MIRIMLIKGAPSREAWDFHKRDRQQKPSGDFHHNLNQNDKIKITKTQYSNPIQKGSTDGRGVNELESSRGSPRYQASDIKMAMMIFELKSGIKHNIGGAINAVILLLFNLKIYKTPVLLFSRVSKSNLEIFTEYFSPRHQKHYRQTSLLIKVRKRNPKKPSKRLTNHFQAFQHKFRLDLELNT